MNLPYASIKDFQKIKNVIYKHKDWFKTVSDELIIEKITNKKCVLIESVVILYEFYANTIRVNVFANENPGNGFSLKVFNVFSHFYRDKFIWLTVNLKNYIAKRFYKKCGMKYCGKILIENEEKYLFIYENNAQKKRILVDMSFTIPHHGHIRLLKKANKLGHVIVALTSDDEIINKKGFKPPIKFKHRMEILKSIKYVDEVIESNWTITDNFLEKHKIDFLVHGDDNENDVDIKKMIIFKKTKNISSTKLRNYE